jgi:hypothetical protein
MKCKHCVNHLSAKMNSNRHDLNYSVVDAVKIYNFGVESTSIRVYMKT